MNITIPVRVDTLHLHVAESKAVLEAIASLGVAMNAELDRLKTEVTEIKGVTASAIVLLEGIAEQIREGAADKAAMTALADDLDTQAKALAAAVAASGTVTPPPDQV